MNSYARDSLATIFQGRLRAEETATIAFATEQAYQHDWLRFSQWCTAHDCDELPAHPKSVACFLKDEKADGAGMATLNRRVAAISYMHKSAGLPTPLAHGEAAIIRDSLSRPPARPGRRAGARPAIELWAEVLEAIEGEALADRRDRALIALHASAAFRLLELSRLTAEQVRFDRASAQIHLGRFRSHTARGASAITVIDDAPLTPVTHLRAWMEVRAAEAGPLFVDCSAHSLGANEMDKAAIGAILAARVAAAGHVARSGSGGLVQIRAGNGLTIG